MTRAAKYRIVAGMFTAYLQNMFFAQKDNLFLWLPVCFAIGIGIYFTIPFEPPVILTAVIWLFVLSIYILTRSSTGKILSSIVFIILLITSGFFTATIRTQNVATPVLSKKTGPVDVTGTILSVDPLEEGTGSRIILSNLEIEDILPEQTPRKIRLRLRADDNIKTGQHIRVLAVLNPPSPPLLPGAFDFRRYLYFQSIGAVGFIYKAPDIITEAPAASWRMEPLRQTIADTIIQTLNPAQSGIALALIVGRKNALSDEDRQALRDAGLAHMLAISGLHVGLAAGALFFVIRLFLCCIPDMALRYPVKKIAAVFALCGAVFYMLLAGATVPTQRAVLMIAIMFLAVILDRLPISLRLVAFAAFIVLLIAPESLMSASFHMSFAAVTCLIYFYDVTRNLWTKWYSKAGWHRKILLYFLGVSVTTVIASIATAPFALYHFGQVSYLGSLANFVAVPLFAFMIMPFALLSLVAMPFGLEYWPLQGVGLGIDYMREIAYWAAGLPAAVIRIPAWGFGSFALLVLSALFMILWKGWGKICALPFMLWALVLAQYQSYPDILVAGSHKLFAFKEEKGSLWVSSRRREKFVLKNWEEYYGLEEGSAETLPWKGAEEEHSFYRCGEEGCRFEIKGQKVSFIRTAYAAKQACHWADIVIAVEPLKEKCQSKTIIDKFDTWEHGAHAVWITDTGVTVKTVAENNAGRPWSGF